MTAEQNHHSTAKRPGNSDLCRSIDVLAGKATPGGDGSALTQRGGGRKRGGQPGNKNALKHGFYAGNFSSTELTDLEVSLAKGLADEIALLRVLIRRFAQDLAAKSGLHPAESSAYLAVISDAMVRLATLLRTDRLLSGSEDSAVMRTITAAIGTFTEDLDPFVL